MALSFSAFPGDDTQDMHLDGRGNLALVRDLEDIRQRVAERLRFWLGEWYLESESGVPYRSAVFTRPVTAGLAASAVTEKIRSVEGVLRVSNVEAVIDPVTRRFRYSAVVHSEYGSMTVGSEAG